MRPDEKVLVMGLVNDRQGALRANMEREMVAMLKQRGYNAVSAFDVYGPNAFKGMNEQKAMSRIRQSDVDQVLTIVMMDKSKEKRYVPGSMYYPPYPYYGRWWGYYSYMYGRVYEPGYYTTNTKYFLESNLYDVKNNNQLLYSVRTETFDPTSAARMAVVYSQQVVKDMTKQQLITKR